MEKTDSSKKGIKQIYQGKISPAKLDAWLEKNKGVMESKKKNVNSFSCSAPWG